MIACCVQTSFSFAQDGLDFDSDINTPWGTQIENGMDRGLVGTWTLSHEVISTGGKQLTNPFAGRTLTITDTGKYLEDYSTENTRDQNLNRHYAVSGKTGGRLKINVDVDMDVTGNLEHIGTGQPMELDQLRSAQAATVGHGPGATTWHEEVANLGATVVWQGVVNQGQPVDAAGARWFVTSAADNGAQLVVIPDALREVFRQIQRPGLPIYVLNTEQAPDDFQLLMRRDMSIGPGRKVKQMGKVRSNAPTFPLGAGRVTQFPDGPWVVYNYKLVPNLNADYNTLVISAMIGAKVTWTFYRKGTAPPAAPAISPERSEINIYSAAIMDMITGSATAEQPQTPQEEDQSVPGLGLGFYIEVVYPAGDDQSWIFWVNNSTTILNIKNQLRYIAPVDKQSLIFQGTPQPNDKTMVDLGLEFPQDNPDEPEGTFTLQVSD